MRRVTAAMVATAALGLSVGVASAESPDYCVIYSKEFVRRALDGGQDGLPLALLDDRTFHSCLHQDGDEPWLPTAYADPAIEHLTGVGAIGESGSEAVAEEAVASPVPVPRPMGRSDVDSASAGPMSTASIEPAPEASEPFLADPRFQDPGYFPPAASVFDIDPFSAMLEFDSLPEAGAQPVAAADSGLAALEVSKDAASPAVPRLLCVAGCGEETALTVARR